MATGARVVRRAARLAGELAVPGDKSISHRAVILGSVAEGRSRFANLAPGADVRSTVSCLRACGAAITVDGNAATIEGSGLRGLREPEDVLDCGNSGTTIRLLSGLLAGQPFLSVLTGDGSLRRRPMGRVLVPLRQMGATVLGRHHDEMAPLVVRGGDLRGLRYELPVASAQVKSALLLAGLYAKAPVEVREPAPSRDHSERMLRAQGAHLSQTDGWLRLLPPERLAPLDLTIPGDTSSAAFWLVAACLHPDARVTVRDVGLNPGRVGFLEALQAMGGRVEVANRRLVAGEPVADITACSSELCGVELAGALIPRLLDEVPVLAVAAALARGHTSIRDAAELRVKESDRIRALAVELARLGAAVMEREDGLEIDGVPRLRGAVCDSHGDHRLAMALAVAGLVAEGETVIHDAGAVDISYPGFWEDLARLAGAP